MPCLNIKREGEIFRYIAPDDDGQFRYSLRPGEYIDGTMLEDCGGEIFHTGGPDVNQLLAELDYELGKHGLGEAFKYLAGPIAKMIGRQNCTSCEVRRVIGNAYSKLKAKHGVAGAVFRMMGLVLGSIRGKEDKVLRKLKAYLDD